jgi:propionyl-CoA carboxylase alpha chain
VQEDLQINGWAVESRIYAEDPYRKFLPSIGRLVRYAPPAEGAREGFEVRNDSGVREGDEISMFYDPMIAKLCTHAPTRLAAVAGMGQALEDFLIEGVGHNIPFLAAVMDQDRFRSGQLSTNYIADEFADGFHGVEPTPAQVDLMAATAVWMHRTQVVRAGRAGGAAFPRKSRRDWVVGVGETKHAVQVDGDETSLTITLADARILVLDQVDWRPGRALFRGRLNGVAFAAEVNAAAEGFTIRQRAAKARVLVLTPLSADLHDRLPKRKAADTSKVILSPMPGLMVSVDVVVGQEVKTGETVAVIEAMKMQNILRAERDGVIKSVGPKAGDSVAADEVLVEFA